MTGIVKTYIEKRGFGFIAPNEGGKEIFVHVKAVKSGTLTVGAEVDFEVGIDREGRSRATKVIVMESL